MHAEPIPNHMPVCQQEQTEKVSQIEPHDNKIVENINSHIESMSVDPKNTNMEVTATRLPRREWRKMKKKQRKKIARTEIAKSRKQQDSEGEEASEISEASKAEEIKKNAERIIWEVRERQIDQANAEKKKKQDEEERRKKIIQENWEKTVKNIRTPKIPKINSIPVEISDDQSNVLEESTIKSDYGTEKDQVNCPFYLKTGACRFGDSCGRNHPYPEKSVTILVKNMYEGMPVQLADEDNDDNLEFDEVEAERHYNEFFEDVHSEFKQYGTILQFKVCNNFQMHLRGNVYVQYSMNEEAEKAINATRGRWYAGKQLVCEYCPVTKWKSAICGYYERNKCPKGIQCNFLHVYKNPGNLYAEADKDHEYFSRKPPDFSEITHSTSTSADNRLQNVSSSDSSSIKKRARLSNRDESQLNHPSGQDRNRTHDQYKERSQRSTSKLDTEKPRHRSRSKLRSRSRSRSPKRRISREKHRREQSRNRKHSSKDYNHERRDVKI